MLCPTSSPFPGSPSTGGGSDSCPLSWGGSEWPSLHPANQQEGSPCRRPTAHHLPESRSQVGAGTEVPPFASAWLNSVITLWPLCPLPSALCPLPSARSPLPSALCPLPSALSPLPSALSPLPCRLCPAPFSVLGFCPPHPSLHPLQLFPPSLSPNSDFLKLTSTRSGQPQSLYPTCQFPI